jgi:hypothetical protein
MRGATVLTALVWLLINSLPALNAQQGVTGYPGFWIFGEDYETPRAGQQDVVGLLVDKESPCRYDGTICTKSVNVLSEPGEFVHDTGRTMCLERTTLKSCDYRMRNVSLADRLDPLRPLGLYPEVDSHTSTTMVA